MRGPRVKENLCRVRIHKECTFHYCPAGSVVTRHKGIYSAWCWRLLLDWLCCNRCCLEIRHLLKSVHLTICPLPLNRCWLPLLLLVLLGVLLLILLLASASLVLSLISASLSLAVVALLSTTPVLILVLATSLALLELLVVATTLALELPLLSPTLLAMTSTSLLLTSMSHYLPGTPALPSIVPKTTTLVAIHLSLLAPMASCCRPLLLCWCKGPFALALLDWLAGHLLTLLGS